LTVPATADRARADLRAAGPSGYQAPPARGPLRLAGPSRLATLIGTFYADSLLDGKPVRTRFIWSHITGVSGRWEQAFSYDAGKTWETNWIMEFQRIPVAALVAR
jgi:hypothetical protein